METFIEREEMERMRKYFHPLRTAFGLSCEEFADVLGISRMTLRNQLTKSYWRMYDFLAYRSVFHIFLEQCEHVCEYSDLYDKFIENVDISDKERDELAERIMTIANSQTKKAGSRQIGAWVMYQLYGIEV